MTILIWFTLWLIQLSHPQMVTQGQTPEASPSGQLETISENVKKRIQGIIQENNRLLEATTALGKLVSINNNTLSIDVAGTIKLASTSAETQFHRLPGNTRLNFEDLTIDEYLIAIGQNNNQVINATQIVAQKNPPESSPLETFYGLIETYDSQEFLLNLRDPINQTLRQFAVGRKTGFFLILPDGTKQVINRTQNLPIQSQALVIYQPSTEPDDSLTATEILILPSTPIITPPELES